MTAGPSPEAGAEKASLAGLDSEVARDAALRAQVQWPYPVGKPHTPWNDDDRQAWLARVTKDGPRRSYETNVVDRLKKVVQSSEFFREHFELVQYGALSHNTARYPLFAVKSRAFGEERDPRKKSMIVTGGVHGYETSGVHGALSFIEDHLTGKSDADREMVAEEFNILVAPCVSPWAYEFVQRWQVNAVDVNRSFLSRDQRPKSEGGDFGEPRTDESALLMDFLAGGPGAEAFDLHMDLHETTDTDSTEFGPARKARDGEDFSWEKDRGVVPAGFYTIGDAALPDLERTKRFQARIIREVAKVTRISPNREVGGAAGVRESQSGFGAIEPGVACEFGTAEGDDPTYPIDGSIVYPVDARPGPAVPTGTCAPSLAGGPTSLATTTEVYPDLPGVSAEECERAQVAALLGGIAFVREEGRA